MKSATRSYQGWFIAVAMSALVLPACLREAPGNACTQRSDCYVGEQCVVGICVTATQGEDMRSEVGPDMTDISRPDTSPDLDAGEDLSTRSDMLFPTDMRPDFSADMPAELPPGAIIGRARLPGKRSAMMASENSTPMVLAYSGSKREGTLELYRRNGQSWTAITIASQLRWPDTDRTEQAALFEDEAGTRIIYEVHEPGVGIALRTASINSSSWTVSADETILPRQNEASLHFDFRHVMRANALVVLGDRIERRARQPNGSWDVVATYSGSFTTARFVVTDEFVCGLGGDDSLRCYEQDDTTTPRIEEAMVQEFETLWEEKGKIEDNKEIVLMHRAGEFVREKLKDNYEGPQDQLGLVWEKDPKAVNVPTGTDFAFARPRKAISYRNGTGSAYSDDPNKREVVAMPMNYDNAVMSPCSQDKDIHIFGSPAAGESSEHIFYETHALP